ncbi:MAG: hypothetical protein U0K42_06705 [Bacteroidales bacterium]|nr:hypothetical protein [Bacteroidales bacterium]
MKRIKSRIKEAKLQFMVKSNILILAIIAFFPYALSAKGIENHVQDMQDVFPFAECLNIFYLVSSYLDEPDWAVAGAQRPHFIKEDPFFSKEKFDNHRIWYHWGLSELGMLSPSLARTHRPLVNIVSRFQHDEQRRFWLLLTEEEQGRLRKLFAKAAPELGFPGKSFHLQEQQVFALVKIMYSIHLLGDHTTKEYHIIRSEEDVRRDIESSIRILAGYNNRTKAMKLIDYLNQTAPISRYSRGTINCSAQKYLDALKNSSHGFSQFLLSCKGFGYNYKDRFREANLKLK